MRILIKFTSFKNGALEYSLLFIIIITALARMDSLEVWYFLGLSYFICQKGCFHIGRQVLKYRLIAFDYLTSFSVPIESLALSSQSQI